MRVVRQLFAVALLIAIGVGVTSSARAAATDVRAAVVGRQKIREELSAALAKGYLTRMDQYHLLLHAKEVLSPADFQAFEQSLDRMARQQAMSRKAAAAARGGSVSGRTLDDNQRAAVTPSQYEEVAAPTTTAPTTVPPAMSATVLPPTRDGGRPMSDSDRRAAETPLIEEVPPGIGEPSMQVDDGDPEDCCAECRCCKRQWIGLDLFTSVDAFKGPMDVGNANGNFGLRFGVNGAVPILQRWGMALQAGMAADLSNLKGSPYPDFDTASSRDQIFATVGMFQRINRCNGSSFTWGFAYDWLFDEYYSDFHFGQWRGKGEFAFNSCDAVGVETSLADHGSTGSLPALGGGVEYFPFKPISQGDVYWTHTFANDISLTGRLGVAERPNNFVFGGESHVPLTRNLALTSSFTYIMPNVGAGYPGQDEEIWNVSVGLEFVPGGFCRCGMARLRPFLPVADNGSFAIRAVQ